MGGIDFAQESGAGKRLLDDDAVAHPGGRRRLPLPRRYGRGDGNVELLDDFRLRESGVGVGGELDVAVEPGGVHAIALLVLRHEIGQRHEKRPQRQQFGE